MQVGDLVIYVEDEEVTARTLPAETSQRGIIVEMPNRFEGKKDQCRVVWFTCDNEGWWDEKRLEVISNASR